MPHTSLIINGKKVDWPSVTTILAVLSKDWKEHWWRKVGFAAADQVSRESRDLGTEVHSLIEAYFTTNYSDLKPSKRAQDLFTLWLAWFKNSGYQPFEVEKKVISKKKRYHGSFDGVLRKEDTKVIVDWKIAKNVGPEYMLQLAGYVYAYFEETGEKIDKGIVVQIHPVKRTVEVHEVNDLFKKYVPLFLSLRRLYAFIKEKKHFVPKRIKAV